MVLEIHQILKIIGQIMVGLHIQQLEDRQILINELLPLCVMK